MNWTNSLYLQSCYPFETHTESFSHRGEIYFCISFNLRWFLFKMSSCLPLTIFVILCTFFELSNLIFYWIATVLKTVSLLNFFCININDLHAAALLNLVYFLGGIHNSWPRTCFLMKYFHFYFTSKIKCFCVYFISCNPHALFSF